jgi:hypothetical protein
MIKIANLLQEILGSKARVAVLRHVINTPGIAARSIETKSGMSWGAIRPSVTQLIKLGVIKQEVGEWANHLHLNEKHLLARQLKKLFEEERRLVTTLPRLIKKELKQFELKGVKSVILDMDALCLYFILDSPGICRDATEYLSPLMEQYHIEIIETGVNDFMKIYDSRSSFMTVITGEKPPFRSIEERLKFFEFE